MKTTMISISTINQHTTIQVRCAGQYLVKNIYYPDGDPKFPFVELAKMMIKIKLNQLKKWFANQSLSNDSAQ